MPGVERLAKILNRADVAVVTPVSVTAALTDGGKLEVGLTNVGAENLDLRVNVRAPTLFTAPARPAVLADLAPGETRKVTFEPGRLPPAGREVRATVQVEVGSHGIRTISSMHRIGR